jgi:hypothetical protein
MKYFKKHSINIMILTLIVMLILFNFTESYKIDTSLSGMEYRIGNEDYSDAVTITIKGVYYKSLFKDDSFEGSISIDKYSFTKDLSLLPIKLIKGKASMYYTKDHSLGELFCSDKLQELLITVREPIGSNSQSWNSKNGLIITAPANNRQQAQDVIEHFQKNNPWLNFTME